MQFGIYRIETAQGASGVLACDILQHQLGGSFAFNALPTNTPMVIIYIGGLIDLHRGSRGVHACLKIELINLAVALINEGCLRKLCGGGARQDDTALCWL